jgi:uncharacterized protein (TIGR03083 family)
MDPNLVHERTRADRELVVEFLDGLTEEQWRAPTLCTGWSVHHVAAHLLQPMLVSFGRALVIAVRFRGDTDRVVDHVTRRLARHSRGEILSLLRLHAADRVSPVRVGPMGPFADTCIHLRDIARPLGADVDVPASDWELVLGYLTGPDVAPALVPRGRLEGLRLEATDSAWSCGSGAAVTGPLEALALAATGRRAALAQLSGPGLHRLDARLRTGGTGS